MRSHSFILSSLRATAMLATLGFSLGAARPAFAASCDAASRQAFLAAAQVRDAAAVAKGEALLACPALKDEAVQWLAFVLAGTGDPARALRLDSEQWKDAARGAKSDRDKALAKARAGDARDLEQRVDRREPGFATVPEPQLVLARALVRHGAFERGRAAYLDYLRIAPDDAAVEGEYLYSFIWEGRLVEADGKLGQITNSAPDELRQTAQRGRALVAKLGGGKALGGSTDVAVGSVRRTSSFAAAGELWPRRFGGPGVSLTGSLHNWRETGRRRSYAATYTGIVDGKIAAHDLRGESLGRYETRVSEARLGAHHDFFDERLFLDGDVGYVSTAPEKPLYATQVRVGQPQGLGARIGASRSPLALALPLAEADLGLLRDELRAGAGYGRYVELELVMAKETGLAPYERHRLLGRIPLVAGEDGGSRVELRLPIGFERHPRPSPHYHADARTRATGVGVEWAAMFAGGLEVSVVADYSLLLVTLRDSGSQEKRANEIAAHLGFAAPLAAGWRLALLGDWFRPDLETAVTSREQPNGVSLAASWQPE